MSDRSEPLFVGLRLGGSRRRLCEARIEYDKARDTGPVCYGVNTPPPNPASLAFHRQRGLATIGGCTQGRFLMGGAAPGPARARTGAIPILRFWGVQFVTRALFVYEWNTEVHQGGVWRVPSRYARVRVR